MAGNESNDRSAPERRDQQGDGHHQPQGATEQQRRAGGESDRGKSDRAERASPQSDRLNQGTGQLGSRSSSEARR